jgi:RNA polymerase-interacting CarD/CdnL/TRCF family regulator
VHQPTDDGVLEPQFDPKQLMTRGEVVNEILTILEEIEKSFIRSFKGITTSKAQYEKLGEVMVAQNVLRKLYYVSELIDMDYYEKSLTDVPETKKAIE